MKQKHIIFEYIRNYITEHNRPPSRQQIAADNRVKLNTVSVHLRRLEDDGLIHHLPYDYSTISITKAGWQHEVNVTLPNVRKPVWTKRGGTLEERMAEIVRRDGEGVTPNLDVFYRPMRLAGKAR